MSKKHFKTIDETYEDIRKRSEAPFSDDLLGIGDVAENIATIISNTNGPFVFNINSPYGTGKTFFTTRLRVLLERNYGMETLFYNAWEFDFYKNPFVSIISEFNNYFEFPEHKETLSAKAKSQLSKLMDSAREVFLHTDTVSLATALYPQETAAAIPLFTFSKIALTWAKKATSKKGKETNIFSEYTAFKSAKEAFVENIEKFTVNLEKPLVFFIDDLDRCRPNYTIEVLETIKHFFHAKNLIFVLAVDRKQIESTVNAMFGANNSTEYLKKFIDQDFYFPVVDSKKYIRTLCEEHLKDIIQPFCKDSRKVSCVSLQGEFANITPFGMPAQTIKSSIVLDIISIYVNALSALYGFSLRTKAQIITFLQIVFKSLNIDKDILIPELVVLLVCIRFFDPDKIQKMNYYTIEGLMDKEYVSKSKPEIRERINTFWIDNDIPSVHVHGNLPMETPIKLWSQYIASVHNNQKLDEFFKSITQGTNRSINETTRQLGIAAFNDGKYPLKYLEIINRLSTITKIEGSEI